MTTTHPTAPYLLGLATEAGKITRDNFGLGVGMQREYKVDNTPLTRTDTAINELVVGAIKRNFPHVQVISEEGDYEVQDARFTVLCDPVDGTIPFCRGIPISAFVISVLKDGQPIEAVIHDPFLDRTWQATRGKGAFMNGNRISVSKHATIRGAHVCSVWWEGCGHPVRGATDILQQQGAVWMNPCSIAYFGGLLASGEFDGTIFPGSNGWETAAMQLIVEEAGGKATDIHGEPLVYGPRGEIRGHILSNGRIHQDILNALESSSD